MVCVLFQWQKVTQANTPHPSHAFVCSYGRGPVSFYLQFNPVPTRRFFLPSVTRCPPSVDNSWDGV